MERKGRAGERESQSQRQDVIPVLRISRWNRNGFLGSLIMLLQ
jgi:hypothetical protein